MKQVLIDRYGAPEEVARCAEVPDVGPPGDGSMSGEDPVMSRGALTSGGQSLVGFILGRGLATRSLEQVRALYADLGRQVLDGTLTAPVEKVYPIDDIKTALAHAQHGGRSGKILVAAL